MGSVQSGNAASAPADDVEGFRADYAVRRVPFRAHDGMDLNLIHVRGPRTPHRGPVLLVHGAGVRASIFQAPTRTTIVDALILDMFLGEHAARDVFPLMLEALGASRRPLAAVG